MRHQHPQRHPRATPAGIVPNLPLALAATGALLLWGPGAIDAEQVYKSVDADGNVTYSATPPPTPSAEAVETLTVDPGPTTAEQRQADQRALQVEATVRQRAAARRAGTETAASTVQAARNQLEDAQEALAEARQRTSVDDWQTIAGGGGRVPSATYLQRVEQAEQRVREAEQALEAARRAAN